MQHRTGMLLLTAITALGACGKALPPQDPAKTRVPVPAAELRAILPGHFIDEQPYALDDGPVTFKANNRFATAWNIEGRYSITDGTIRLDGDAPFSRFHDTLRFVKDGNGKLYYSRSDDAGERTLKLVRDRGFSRVPPPPPRFEAPNQNSR